MSPVILLSAAIVVTALSVYLLRVSGAGRELFGRDAWMLRAPDSEHLQRSSGTFIEDHEFWSLDPTADRDFWDEIPDDDEDGEGDVALASGDH